MDECSVNGLAARTACILTYAGSIQDMAINYATLGLLMVICLFRARDTFLEIPEASLQSRWLLSTVAAFLGVCGFQISLCWWLGCAGISIIWCALAGWLVNERKRHERPGDAGQAAVGRRALDVWEDVTLTVVLGVLVYYATVAPVITTVAHVCALTLGTLLSRIIRRLVLASSQMYECVASTEDNHPTT